MTQTEVLKVKSKSKPKKGRKLILKILGGIVIALVLFLVGVFTYNKIASKSDLAKIEPYGKLVTVDGKNMNVFIQGEGEETIVLLPGQGTSSPVLDFKPLIDELSQNYRVVAIEPFGYGLSDYTDKERTTQNIITEIHEAVRALNIDRYILMGHSITGLYGIEYVDKYREEVTAFAGIDSSVPTQPGMDTKLPIGLFRFVKETGLARLLSGGPDAYDKDVWSEDTRKQLSLLSLKNGFNPTMLNELEHLSSNFQASASKGITFPSDLPLILFVDTSNTEVKGWVPLHEEQIKDSLHGKVIFMDSGHYLHHKNYKKIAEDFSAFMTEVKKDTAQ